MQVTHAEFLQVGQFLYDALEVAGEAFSVGGVADHPRRLNPVGVDHPVQVEAAQVRVAVPVGDGSRGEDSPHGFHASFGPVQVGEAFDEVGGPFVKTRGEDVASSGVEVIDEGENVVTHIGGQGVIRIMSHGHHFSSDSPSAQLNENV